MQSLNRGHVGSFAGQGSEVEGAVFASVPRKTGLTIVGSDEAEGGLGRVVQHGGRRAGMRGGEVVRSRRWAFKTPRAWGALRFAFRTLPAARLNLPCLASHAGALIHRQNPQCARRRGWRWVRGDAIFAVAVRACLLACLLVCAGQPRKRMPGGARKGTGWHVAALARQAAHSRLYYRMHRRSLINI